MSGCRDPVQDRGRAVRAVVDIKYDEEGYRAVRSMGMHELIVVEEKSEKTP